MASVPCPKLPPTTRRCLRCDVEFPSAGPQNRLCQECRTQLASGPSQEPTYVVPRRWRLRAEDLE
jgi:hypothetical protein